MNINKMLLLLLFVLSTLRVANAYAAEVGVIASAKLALSLYSVGETSINSHAERTKLDLTIAAVVDASQKISLQIRDDRMRDYFAEASALLLSYQRYRGDVEKKSQDLTRIAMKICKLLDKIRSYTLSEDGYHSLYLTAPYFALHSVEVAIEEWMIMNEIRPDEARYEALIAIIESGMEMGKLFQEKYKSIRDCHHSEFALYSKIHSRDPVKELIYWGPMTRGEPAREKFEITCPGGAKVPISWVNWEEWHKIDYPSKFEEPRWKLDLIKAVELCSAHMRDEPWYKDYLQERAAAFNQGEDFDCRFNHNDRQIYQDYFTVSKYAMAKLEFKKGSVVFKNLSNNLSAGQKLCIDDKLISMNGEYSLIMQGDHNLVVYKTVDDKQKPVWSSKTRHVGSTWAAMQSDGNFVLYTGEGKPRWASGTSAQKEPFLLLRTDGRVCVYGNGKCLWMSNNDE